MLKNVKERKQYLKESWNVETDIDPELIRVSTKPIADNLNAVKIEIMTDGYDFSTKTYKREKTRKMQTVFIGLIDDAGVYQEGTRCSISHLVKILTDHREDEVTKALSVDGEK